HARAKADRLSLTRAVGANLSPIFSLYDDPQSAVAPIVTAATAERPRLALSGEEGEQHTVWSITDVQRFRDLARVLSNSLLYIADGHHRYETALNFRDKVRSEHPEAPPDAAFNYALMLLVDAADPGLVILPTHRLVHDLDGFDRGRLVRALSARYSVQTYTDRAREGPRAAVLGHVERGSAQAAFLLRPPAVADVAAAAQAGQVMPQKSTYFYPKPASGIVFNPLDPAIRVRPV